MGNCYKVYLHDRLFIIVQYEMGADYLIRTLCAANGTLRADMFRVESAYVEKIGF